MKFPLRIRQSKNAIPYIAFTQQKREPVYCLDAAKTQMVLRSRTLVRQKQHQCDEYHRGVILI